MRAWLRELFVAEAFVAERLHRWRRNGVLLRHRPPYLRSDGLDADPLLERGVHDRPVVPEARLAVSRTELQRAREHLLRPQGVPATEQDFTQVAKRFGVSAVRLAGRNERGLSLREQTCVQMHAPNREHHAPVLDVPGIRASRDLADQLLAGRVTEKRTERDGRIGVGVAPPLAKELVERAHIWPRILRTVQNL